MENLGNQTKIIHTEYAKKDIHNSLRMPIYGANAFEFETAEQMALAFRGQVPDHTYTRISNPTTEHLEHKVRGLTGALATTAVASGMAAISNVFFTIAKAGDNFITSKHLFGNTYTFFVSTIAAFGVEVRFCDLNNPAEIEKNIDERTIGVFFEILTNPQLEIVDCAAVAAVAHKHNIPVIVDTTVVLSGYFDAKKLGIDIEVISTTKIFSVGATSIGGMIVDYGTYNWANNSKLADFAQKFGPFAFNAKLRKEIFRNVGACMSPHNAYLQSLGLESAPLRFEKAVSNTHKLAQFLQSEPRVKSVNYPGLSSSPFYATGKKQFGEFCGAILTLNLSSKEECFSFMNKLKVICRATNLYDNRTLIIHPASTIYWDMTDELRNSLNIPDTMLRVAVGIEDIDDLINDMKQAL